MNAKDNNALGGDPETVHSEQPALAAHPTPKDGLAARVIGEFAAWLRTLSSAAVYATLIVTFFGQVARVEGYSMQPTLENQDRLVVNKLAYEWGTPQPGDIVMLYEPDVPDRALVKRVIGVPGDEIRIEGGRVYRNGESMADRFVAGQFRSHDDLARTIVPRGYYFVMGDHRNDSLDSRSFGCVPRRYIVGRVQLRWWPLEDARLFK